MNKQLNTSFIKQLIDLDFPFVKSLTKKENLNTVTTYSKLNNRNQFNILDIFKLNNSLKQFIRILFSLKYREENKSKFLIYI